MIRLALLGMACLVSISPSLASADPIFYSFSPELRNSSTGADFLVNIGFYADPTMATKDAGPSGFGETYSVVASSLAVTVFDLGGTSSINSLTYSKSDLQNAGLVYFYPFSSANPQSASADPFFTLSAKNPGGSDYITLLLNGSSVELFESAAKGDTSGTPLASARGLSSVPEPSAALPFAILATGMAVFRMRKQRISA